MNQCDTIRIVNIDEAFSGLSHAFPRTAEWQGRHFLYAQRGQSLLIETKKSTFRPCGTCPSCGQERGERDSRFYYWLLVDGQFKLVHAGLKSKLKPLKTIGESIPLLVDMSRQV